MSFLKQTHLGQSTPSRYGDAHAFVGTDTDAHAAAIPDQRTFLSHRRYQDDWNRWYASEGVKCATDYIELQCRRHHDRHAIEYIGDDTLRSHPLTYGELNHLSNRLASYFLSKGLPNLASSGASVCILIENSPMFIMVWLAIAKIGITAALLNTSLKEKQLQHSIRISTVAHHAAGAGTCAGADRPAPRNVVIVSETFKDVWSATEELYRRDGEEPPQVFWTRGGEVDFSEARNIKQDANTTTQTTSDESSNHPSSSSSPSSSPSPSPFLIESSFVMPVHVSDSLRCYRSFRHHIHWESPLFLIYTSGTTGPSKAAIFSQRRFLGAGLTWSYPMNLTEKDKYLIVLPLYHGNGGVVAVSACMHVGCVMVIRSKFSTSNFWSDVRLHQCTAMIYVGELWRYLHTQPVTADDVNNPLRVIAGNGLRVDIWSSVVSRFGIERVVEHYGMTEMPAGPYMNFYGRPGACGFIPPEIRSLQGADKLVAYSVEDACVIRDDVTGHCTEVIEPQVVGEALFLLAPGIRPDASQAENPHTEGGQVDATTAIVDTLGNPLYKPYRNYTDLSACERRVYRNVFSDRDAWFSTGDLLKLDVDGFFYFCDRIGDTYRWKGENVATNDVGEALCAAPDGMIKEANVYGVIWPGQEGRAGMASIVVDTHTFDTRRLLSHLFSTLPPFAIPSFLRLRTSGEENSKTSTLKFQKVQYQLEGFQPSKVGKDRLFWWPGARLGKQQQQQERKEGRICEYVPITEEVYQQINGAGQTSQQ